MASRHGFELAGLLAFVLLCSCVPSAPQLNFAGYAVPLQELRPVTKASIPASSINLDMRQSLEHNDQAQPDFAGHYTLRDSGCGTGCLEFALIDHATGRVHPGMQFNVEFPPSYPGPKGLDHRRDSRLLIVRRATGFRYPVFVDYYAWDGSGFVWRRNKRLDNDAEVRSHMAKSQ
jgi:hypothetical protein